MHLHGFRRGLAVALTAACSVAPTAASESSVITTIHHQCRCQFPFTYNDVEYITCTDKRGAKHTTSGALTAVWCRVQDGCGTLDSRAGDNFWYDECPIPATVPMPPPPPSPPASPPSNLGCCRAEGCQDVATKACGRREWRGDECGACAESRHSCTKWYYLNRHGAMRPCVWTRFEGGNGTCVKADMPTDEACGFDRDGGHARPPKPPSPPHAPRAHHAHPPHSPRGHHAHPPRSPPSESGDGGATAPPPTSASPSPSPPPQPAVPPSPPAPPAAPALLTKGTAALVGVAVLVGIGVAGLCWCALRAINGWAAERATTRTQRFHDEVDEAATPDARRRPARSAPHGCGSETELALSAAPNDGDDEPHVPVSGSARKGRRGKRANPQHAAVASDEEDEGAEDEDVRGAEKKPLDMFSNMP